MYKIFHVPKEAGTYADTLEMYGVAHLLTVIFKSQSRSSTITINDKGIYYEVIPKHPITMDLLDGLQYFQVVKFIQKDDKNKPPVQVGQEFFNYPLQRDLRREKRKEIEKALKENKGETYTKKRQWIEEKYQSEKVAQPLQDEYDVFAQLVSNPYAAFLKLYGNFDKNQTHFKVLISEVLNQYLPKDNQIPTDYKTLLKFKKMKVEEKATMLQLLNPNQGKGLNKAKATGMSVGNLKGHWVKETMKVSGALNFGMICQSVKVGSSYDLKIFVPAFNAMRLNDKIQILKEFKKYVKSNTPIKLDILNTLRIIELFLKKSTKSARRGKKAKEHLLGLHSVYQKDLGQNKAVVNIGFLETPDFIDLADKNDWLTIIEDQKKLINGITEQGDAMIGLLAYRNFLNGSNIDAYFKFNYWYAIYLMHELSNKKQRYVTTNKIETLNKIFSYLNNETMKFKEIIEDEGFKSVATAIRKSTVSLQYTPKGERKFDVQYGVAQKLQNKSKSPEDLIGFVSEFIAKYNSDTARKYELYKSQQEKGKNPSLSMLRTRVEEEHMIKFYQLADKVNNSKVLGAMLAAYGFALNKKSKTKTA